MSLICDPCQQRIFLAENLPYEGQSACCALPELLPQLPDTVQHTPQKGHEDITQEAQAPANLQLQCPTSYQHRKPHTAGTSSYAFNCLL